MYSVCKFTAACILALTVTPVFASTPELRVCADANNLPYSNRRQQGFENKLAELIARDLGRQIRYVWWPQNPARIHKLFRSGVCDLVMEMPAGYDLAQPTHPYYTSSYVFVSRQIQHLEIRSFDDPYLRTASIGLHVVGDDNALIPPQRELLMRGIIRNIVGFSGVGDSSHANPSAELITAVAKGRIDLAIAWGPLAGYFAERSTVPLSVQPICPKSSIFPVAFSMSMGVRRGENALLAQLNSEIERRHNQINRILRGYGVPLVDPASEPRSCK